PCLRSCRFKDEPQNHGGDSKRNRAKPQLNQYAPPTPTPVASGARSNGNARPPTRAKASMLIAAKIVRSIRSVWAFFTSHAGGLRCGYPHLDRHHDWSI